MPDIVETLTPDEQAEFDSQRGEVVTPLREQDAPTEPVIVEPTQETETPPADERPKTVPHAALHEEREAHKLTKQEVAELRDRYSRLEERTNIILQQMQKPAQAETPAAIPDPNADPLGHLLARLDQSEKALQAIQSTGQQAQQRLTEAEAIQRLATTSAAMENEYRQQTPDYDNAVAHLVRSRNDELISLGLIDPGQRAMQIRNESLQIAQAALNQRKNPGELIYALAQMRGYQKPAVETAAATATATPDPQKQLETLARGQQQARTLSSARGAGPQELTADRLANMTDEDFAKVYQTKEARALMGARN